MSLQLHVLVGPDRDQRFDLKEGDALLLGRSRAATARLMDPYVSRIHCQVQAIADRVLVTDFDSAGGTFVNRRRIKQAELQAGDVLVIGETHLQLVHEGATPVRQDRPVALTGLVGKKLAHYQVGDILAKGQLGMVFHALDTKNQLPAALKVLGPEFSANESARQRFVRAVKTMLPLRHPNLIALLAAGKTGPFCWIAMEYIEGESLTQVIQRIGTVGMLDWQHALRVAIHIARALDFAHGQGIIHRSITPMNIMIRARDKTALLGDLILAKAMQDVGVNPITKPGEIVGDLHYMSPERTYGNDQVDGRADLFSLGATVYALLTGRPPFAGGTLQETLAKIRGEEPGKPKKFQLAIPDLFEGIVLQLLAKRPEDRFATAGKLLVELERLASFHDVET